MHTKIYQWWICGVASHVPESFFKKNVFEAFEKTRNASNVYCHGTFFDI